MSDPVPLTPRKKFSYIGAPACFALQLFCSDLRTRIEGDWTSESTPVAAGTEGGALDTCE